MDIFWTPCEVLLLLLGELFKELRLFPQNKSLQLFTKTFSKSLCYFAIVIFLNPKDKKWALSLVRHNLVVFYKVTFQWHTWLIFSLPKRPYQTFFALVGGWSAIQYNINTQGGLQLHMKLGNAPWSSLSNPLLSWEMPITRSLVNYIAFIFSICFIWF
jgi:hypothetical protein